MKFNKYIYSILALLVMTSCQQLEDTYAEYSGDGLVRYIGKCKNVVIAPAWHKLDVTWENSVDANIKSVIIKWSYIGHDGLVSKEDKLNAKPGSINNSYRIEDIDDNVNIEIKITAMDGDGNKSLETISYGRPFTYEHEDVISFSQLVSNKYILGNTLIVFYSDWNDKIQNATFNYTDVSGTAHSLTLDEAEIGRGYRIFDNVDASKLIEIYRDATIGMTNELIHLETITLDAEPKFSPDLVTLLNDQYPNFEPTVEFCAGITTLDINTNLSTLEGILNFPNLRTLNFGNKRYVIPNLKANDLGWAEVSEDGLKNSKIALNTLSSLFADFKATRYLLHYSKLDDSSVTTIDTPPVLPINSYIPLDVNKMTCNHTDIDYLIFGSLIDNNPQNPFFIEAEIGKSGRVLEFIFDVRENGGAINVKGFDITQVETSIYAWPRRTWYAPSYVKIQYSNNKITWSNVSYLERVKLGKTRGEVTHLELDEIIDAKYIKLIIGELPNSGGRYGSVLGEFSIF